MKPHFGSTRFTFLLLLQQRSVWVAACVVGLITPGCGTSDGIQRQPVAGIVSLDGKPLDAGSIRFEPQGSGPGISSGAVIKDGQFSLDSAAGLPQGKYKVAISAPEGGTATPSMPDPKVPEPRERIPAKYNLSTTLSVDVDAKTAKELKFDLVSK